HVAPDRVGEHVDAVHLDEHGGVVDESDAQLSFRHPHGRSRRRRRIGEIGPSAGSAVSPPADEVGQRRVAEDLVVEQLAVEMVAHPAVRVRAGKLAAAGAEQGDDEGAHALAMLQRGAAMPDRIAIRTNRDLAPYIDHTLLKPGATREELVKLCDEARTYGFATVCVASHNVALCARLLQGSRTRPISVVGFPSGTETTEAKVAEARAAISAGAAEIDMVIHVGRLKAKDYAYVERDIRAVVEATTPRPVKVILEKGALDRDEKVIGCALAKAAGAAF